MAGRVPAIHVFASHLGIRHGYVDARIKSGHDELVGLMPLMNESEHQVQSSTEAARIRLS
jgi:hypothetical protein